MTEAERQADIEKDESEFTQAWPCFLVVSISYKRGEVGYISPYTLRARSLAHAWHCFLRDEVLEEDKLPNGEPDPAKMHVISVEQTHPHPLHGQFLKVP